MATETTEKGGGVYSVRFNASEVELLKSIAEREDMKIADVIREAIQILAIARREPTLQFAGAREIRAYVYRGEPPSSGTRWLGENRVDESQVRSWNTATTST